MEVRQDRMETLRHHVVRIHTRGANAIVDARSIAQEYFTSSLGAVCSPGGATDRGRIERPNRFPRVRGASLERRAFALPDGFEGACLLVSIAFKRKQQGAIDTWIPTTQHLAQQHPDVRYYELSAISCRVPLARWWLDGAMGAGIADCAAREATITLYLDKAHSA